MKLLKILATLLLITAASMHGARGAVSVLVEAESFSDAGGWLIDPQFVEQMGSPFLIAHGAGKPVRDAVTTVAFPETGTYRLWVRTRDWVPDHPDNPGQFKVLINGLLLPPLFGTTSASWQWQDGGLVQIPDTNVSVALRDLTGFDARCDALAFVKNSDQSPPAESQPLYAWRQEVRSEPPVPAVTESFDCVIVGGGMAGCAASLAASRSGLRVALLHDRNVLGGNASQEIRVASRGEIRHPIVDEIDTFNLSNRDPGTVSADLARYQTLSAESNLTLFLSWRAFAVTTNSLRRITSVDARHITTGQTRRFAAKTFIDCTGDAWIGYWAGADYRVGREAASEFGETRAPATPDRMTMGNSLMWTTSNSTEVVPFPATSMSMQWATTVAGTNAAIDGEWNWEYGMHLDTIADAEQIRDHLLRAIYGNFFNAKQLPAHANRCFAFLPYIAGKRESRRLMGDYIVTQQDITSGVYFEDAVGTATWGIDLHYPTATSYLSTYTATSVSRWYYPFRSLYSRDIPNLLMAGRCISVSHVGLGSPRVQNTTAQMGVAVGYAAALCKTYNLEPRDIYRSKDRTLELQSRIGGTWPERSPAHGIVVDNTNSACVTVQGAWTSSAFDLGYFGTNYLHDGNTGKGQKSVSFRPTLPAAGHYTVYLRWTGSGNRATNAPVALLGTTNPAPVLLTVNQTQNGSRWVRLGTYHFEPAAARVIVANSNTAGFVIADAVQFVDPSNLSAESDVDNDGLPDFWERWHFLSETAATPGADADQDGRTNYQEYLTGTDPLDPKSRFDVRALLDSVPHTVVLRWPSATNRTYRIEVSSDLGEFRTATQHIPATPPENTAKVVMLGDQQYFRVVPEP